MRTLLGIGYSQLARRKPYPVSRISLLLVCVALIALTTTHLRAASPVQAAGNSTTAQQTPPATQRRIAVLPFGDAAVKSSAQRVFGYDIDVGKSLADLLVRELMKSDSCSVMDPKAVDKLLAEHMLPKANLADRNSIVKLGKILGVDGIVIGEVTQFGNVGPRLNFDELPRRRATAEAEARLVNIATGEIVAVAAGRSVSQRTGASLLGGWHRVGDGPIDFGSSDFQRTLLGEAVNGAVNKMAADLAAETNRLTSTSSR